MKKETIPLVTDSQVENFYLGYCRKHPYTELTERSPLINREAQRDADFAVLEEWKAKRLEYEKEFTTQIVEHTRRDIMLESGCVDTPLAQPKVKIPKWVLKKD